jgi:hypothetical protein
MAPFKKYIHVYVGDKPTALLWASAARGIDLSLTTDPSPYVLPLSGWSASHFASKKDVLFMGVEALSTVSNRQTLAGLGVSVLPTITPLNAKELLAFETGPIFVKPTNTQTSKSTDALAYTKWDSPQHLIAAVDASFWANQTDGAKSFCVQPLVPYPITEITAYISVNEASQAFLYFSAKDTSEIIDRRSLIQQPTNIPQYALDDIQKVCTALSIKGGVHDIQFIEYNGKFYMNDWNARPGAGINVGMLMEKTVRQSALAHMVGEPTVEVPNFYGEQRGYWGRNIPESMADEARAMGMFARCNDGFLSRVYYEGPDVATVHTQFNIFETKI